jgi:hypothetical protein
MKIATLRQIQYENEIKQKQADFLNRLSQTDPTTSSIMSF